MGKLISTRLLLSKDRRGPDVGSVLSDLPQMVKTGNRKIGLPMLAIGAGLTVLGVSLFFNKTLLRLGNLFFVAGVPMTIGAGRTAGYFLQSKKMRATGCLTSGIFLVFIGWPVIGIALEAFGMLNLFGNMFPVALAVLKTMPVIGPLLRGDGVSERRGRSRYSGDDEDDYYRGSGPGYDGGNYDDGRDNDNYSRAGPSAYY
jgi:Got1/Sft2-like family